MMGKGVAETEIFEQMPVRKAVVTLAVPTVISQLVVLIYSMADTWFVGQTGDPRQVAAVTVCYPVFLMLNSIANLLGIGGGSLVSRLLGQGKKEKAGRVATFTLWAAGIFTLCYSAAAWFFGEPLLNALGTETAVLPYARDYLFWTVVAGGVPTVLGLTFASLIRAEGGARISSIGMSLGGILNVIFDPIFIFLLNMDVGGAALATGLSNTISLLYLARYYVRSRKTSIVKATLMPKKLEPRTVGELLSTGTPAALQILLSAVSGSVLLNLMSGYETAVISGVGVMQKVEVIPFQIAQGVSSGVLPLVAYSYASGNRERMQQAIRFAMKIELAISVSFFVIFEIFAHAVVSFFISDPATVEYGAEFVRLRCLALPFITVEFMLIAVFQAIGGAKQAFILSLFRKGIVDLPLMFVADILWPVYGIMLVQPVMECLGAGIAAVLYRRLHLHRSSAGDAPPEDCMDAHRKRLPLHIKHIRFI